MEGFGLYFSRCRYAIYLYVVSGWISSPHCSSDVSSYGASVKEQISWSEMENVTHNCKLTYGTCMTFGSFYSFQINVYDISYSPVLPIKDLINIYDKTTIPFKLAIDKNLQHHIYVFYFVHVMQKKLLQILVQKR